jgi:hypothetical protein
MRKSQQSPRYKLQFEKFLCQTSIPKDFVDAKQPSPLDLRMRLNELDLRLAVPLEQLLDCVNRIGSDVSLAN